jgi:hypothetical protein
MNKPSSEPQTKLDDAKKDVVKLVLDHADLLVEQAAKEADIIYSEENFRPRLSFENVHICIPSTELKFYIGYEFSNAGEYQAYRISLQCNRTPPRRPFLHLHYAKLNLNFGGVKSLNPDDPHVFETWMGEKEEEEEEEEKEEYQAEGHREIWSPEFNLGDAEEINDAFVLFKLSLED